MRSNICTGQVFQNTGSSHCLARLQSVRPSRVVRCMAAHLNTTEIKKILEALPVDVSSKVVMALLESQEALIESKDAHVKSEQALVKSEQARADTALRLSRTQQTLATAMFLAGVTSGRSMLDFVLEQKTGGVLSMKAAWEKMLAADEHLLDCIVATTTAWAGAVKDEPSHTQQSIIANNIATVHGALSNGVHSFVPEAGLTIYEGVPDTATTAVLRCVCERNGIPYEVQKPARALAADDG